VLRGKKILVVGDDKQVSPDGGFISSVRIQELKDRFLSDQPYSTVLTPEKSLYDIASTVFAAQKVIAARSTSAVCRRFIAYSNTFYDGFITAASYSESIRTHRPTTCRHSCVEWHAGCER